MNNTLFHRCLVKLLFTTAVVLLASFAGTAQTSSKSLSSMQDPKRKQISVVDKVKFSVPKSFNLLKSNDPQLGVMRHEKYDLMLFVAIPKTEINHSYLTKLSNSVASKLFPDEKEFEWKILAEKSENPESKVSDFQEGSGITKGFNQKKFVQTDYFVLKVKDREILVGYITQLGNEGKNGKYLFDLPGSGGLSMPGWYAQAHIISSVTGEPYERINPGTVITAVPAKKN